MPYLHVTLILLAWHLSVHLSVMLMDCDHIVQQKVRIGFGYLHAEPTQIIICCDRELYRGRPMGYGKWGVSHFGGNNVRNGAGYALDQYRTLIGNHIQRIEWYHLSVPTAMRNTENHIQNPSNSARRIMMLWYRSICWSSCYVYFLL